MSEDNGPRRLFNQTAEPLWWRMLGRLWEVEPYGSINVTQKQAEFIERRGLPLGPSPVAGEAKAARAAALEIATASEAEHLKLREALEIATGEKVTVTNRLVEEELLSGKLKKKSDGLEKKLQDTKARLVEARAEVKALHAEMETMAATIADLRSARKTLPLEAEPKVKPKQ